jgi:hypothetical protein
MCLLESAAGGDMGETAFFAKISYGGEFGHKGITLY